MSSHEWRRSSPWKTWHVHQATEAWVSPSPSMHTKCANPSQGFNPKYFLSLRVKHSSFLLIRVRAWQYKAQNYTTLAKKYKVQKNSYYTLFTIYTKEENLNNLLFTTKKSFGSFFPPLCIWPCFLYWPILWSLRYSFITI